MVQDRVLDRGDAVVEASFMYNNELKWAKDLNTSWYRSKQKKGGQSTFVSYMLNKKWTLEEEFNNHLLKFQQVPASYDYNIKDHFDIPGWIDNR